MYSKEPAFNALIMSGAYIGARAMCAGNYLTATGACLNPAIALGTTIVMFFNDGGIGFKWIWLYCSIPFGGAILAVTFHEFLYKKIKTAATVEEEDSSDGESPNDSMEQLDQLDYD